MMTKTKMLRGLILGMVTSFAALPALADGRNWDDDKRSRVETNRQSDAGIGNGGERKHQGRWQETIWGEDGPMDADPGRSGAHNQACPTDATTAASATEC